MTNGYVHSASPPLELRPYGERKKMCILSVITMISVIIFTLVVQIQGLTTKKGLKTDAEWLDV